MARIANTKDIIANGAVSYIVNKLQDALEAFHEELNEETKFSAAHVSGRDSAAKASADEAIRMLRWLYEVEFSLTPPTPLADGDVDAINIDIRTFDDGL